MGIAVDGQLLQVRTTRSDIEVILHDGGELDAVVRADVPTVLGLAAGMLTLNDTHGLVDIEGDEAAARALFNPGMPTPARAAHE
ncbi:hypothetical protein [Nonomuraea recticatena]|uniref:Uncharacterized protein n=1 Tax=Nonomuraea recticatena TaxID=46178 RepID=A0ABP6FSZ1_9ACTN